MVRWAGRPVRGSGQRRWPPAAPAGPRQGGRRESECAPARRVATRRPPVRRRVPAAGASPGRGRTDWRGPGWGDAWRRGAGDRAAGAGAARLARSGWRDQGRPGRDDRPSRRQAIGRRGPARSAPMGAG